MRIWSLLARCRPAKEERLPPSVVSALDAVLGFVHDAQQHRLDEQRLESRSYCYRERDLLHRWLAASACAENAGNAAALCCDPFLCRQAWNASGLARHTSSLLKLASRKEVWAIVQQMPDAQRCVTVDAMAFVAEALDELQRSERNRDREAARREASQEEADVRGPK